jgi:predicted Fe-Mo cluster-binding NifX family protein
MCRGPSENGPVRAFSVLSEAGIALAQDRGVVEERIAVTVWEERISPVFDVARKALLITLDGGREVAREDLVLPDEGGHAKLALLRRHRVGTLLCGAVSRPVALHAAALGIRLVAFLAGDAEEVVAAHLDGRVASGLFFMPGCRGHWGRRGNVSRWWAVGDGDRGERRFAMPSGDGTGPRGQGPGTGRGLGPCGGGNRGGGRGPGGGKRPDSRGGGRGGLGRGAGPGRGQGGNPGGGGRPQS